MSAIPPEAIEACIKNTTILAQAAQLLVVPTIVTEQHHKGLDHTVPALLALMPSIKPVAKLSFSCLAEATFSRQLTHDRAQTILSSMEAHICVLQTALDLMAVGKQVYVAEDAVISRNAANKANALARMREAGCSISNTESIIFEWLGVAQDDAFRTLNKLIR